MDENKYYHGQAFGKDLLESTHNGRVSHIVMVEAHPITRNTELASICDAPKNAKTGWLLPNKDTKLCRKCKAMLKVFS